MQSPYEGRLIRLRAREPEDEPLLHQWFNDPEVTEYLGGNHYPVSRRQEREFIERTQAITFERAGFSVESLADGRLIGGVWLELSSPENRSAGLGITIGDKTYWDSGYGTDTMRAICRFGFEMMNLHRIELEVFEENRRAIAVYERVGFRAEGCRRDARFKFGAYHNALVMGLLEGELIGERS